MTQQMHCLCGETRGRITAHRCAREHSVANYFKSQTGLQCPFLDMCPRLGSHTQISACEWGPSGLILPYRCFSVGCIELSVLLVWKPQVVHNSSVHQSLWHASPNCSNFTFLGDLSNHCRPLESVIPGFRISNPCQMDSLSTPLNYPLGASVPRKWAR